MTLKTKLPPEVKNDVWLLVGRIVDQINPLNPLINVTFFNLGVVLTFRIAYGSLNDYLLQRDISYLEIQDSGTVKEIEIELVNELREVIDRFK